MRRVFDTSSTPAEHQASAQPSVPAASAARRSSSAARCAALPLGPAICGTRDAALLLPLLAAAACAPAGGPRLTDLPALPMRTGVQTSAGATGAVAASLMGLPALPMRTIVAGNAAGARLPLPPSSARTS